MDRKVLVQRSEWMQRIEFLLTEGRHIGLPVIMQEAKDGIIGEPTFSLSPDEAQNLMDALWFIGLRPTEGTGSAGALAATQKHLDDMRRLVFDKKGG